MKSFHKVSNYFPSLDRIIGELKNRFAENDQKHLVALGSLVFDDDPSQGVIELVCEFYSLEKDAMFTDIKLYKHFKVKHF